MSVLSKITPLLALSALALTAPAAAQDDAAGTTLNDRLSGDLITHDPVIIREDDTYYVFTTVGRYIGIKTSPDLEHWTNAGAVFEEIPAWAKEAVPGTEGIWAPDIAFVDGEYRHVAHAEAGEF